MLQNAPSSDAADAAGTRLDAVLPLVKRDLACAERLLLPSLRHFFTALGTCWIVVPDADVTAVASRLADPHVHVVGENELIPEVRWFRRPAPEDAAAGGLTGQAIQQLAKLSIARRLANPFYVTLNADLICCRTLDTADLVPNGRALAVVSDTDDDPQPTWSVRAAVVLDLPRARRRYGETPAVLSRDGVLSLLAFLEERLRPNALRAEALLLSHLPWTAPTLYATYLDHTGLFDRYHLPAPAGTGGPDPGDGKTVATLDPAALFAPDTRRWFAVLPGCTVRDLAAVISRIRTYFASTGQPSPF